MVLKPSPARAGIPVIYHCCRVPGAAEVPQFGVVRWSVEKNRGLGANARLGYAPGGWLGESGSVYFVTGVHWERATVRRGSDIGGEAIRVVADHTLRPWVAGAGVEWGSLANRVGLQVRYSAADLEFRTGGDGRRSGCLASITLRRARGRRSGGLHPLILIGTAGSLQNAGGTFGKLNGCPK